jgi:hypothetical protein
LPEEALPLSERGDVVPVADQPLGDSDERFLPPLQDLGPFLESVFDAGEGRREVPQVVGDDTELFLRREPRFAVRLEILAEVAEPLGHRAEFGLALFTLSSGVLHYALSGVDVRLMAVPLAAQGEEPFVGRRDLVFQVQVLEATGLAGCLLVGDADVTRLERLGGALFLAKNVGELGFEAAVFL